MNTNALSYRCFQDGNSERGHNSAYHPASEYRQGHGGERKTADGEMSGSLTGRNGRLGEKKKKKNVNVKRGWESRWGGKQRTERR